MFNLSFEQSLDAQAYSMNKDIIKKYIVFIMILEEINY
ncbi:hypothetical protein ASZ90_005173 [hydrocarbon metagenome]|uniref:Uncharacterized protein n=1 Tax=hydrocarbon metagenome TaxID=938273 RepID=A0A0W8FVR5_9ZZZZ